MCFSTISKIFLKLLSSVDIVKRYLTPPLLALLIIGRKTTILYEILNIVVLWMPRFLTPWITLFLIPATSFIRKDYSEDPIDIPDNIPDDDYLLSE